jgi:hypothetical protein
MGIKRGMRALHEARTQGAANAGDMYRLRLYPNETAIIRLFGNWETEEAPVVGVTHYVRDAPAGKQYNNCAENAEPGTHAGCVFCYVMDATRDKKIKKSSRAYMHAKDLRLIHKLDTEVSILRPGIPFVPGKQYKPDDYLKTKYPPCKRQKCQYCASGNTPQPQGHRLFELAGQYAEQISVLQTQVRDYCKCGSRTEEGEGTLYVSAYACPACNTEVEFDPQANKAVATCTNCGETHTPNEYLGCTNEECPGPERCDIPDFVLRVTKTGEGTATAYSFEPVHPCKPLTEEELAEAAEHEPKWEDILAPQPAELQAGVLGIPCPFETPGHGARGYSQAPPPAAKGSRFVIRKPEPEPEPEDDDIAY